VRRTLVEITRERGRGREYRLRPAARARDLARRVELKRNPDQRMIHEPVNQRDAGGFGPNLFELERSGRRQRKCRLPVLQYSCVADEMAESFALAFEDGGLGIQLSECG